MAGILSLRSRATIGRLIIACALLIALTPLALGHASVSAAPQQQTFTNSAPMSTPNNAGTSLYPSQIAVSGLSGTITNVSVTLFSISHSRPDDLDVLLVGPLGQNVLLMSDSCGSPDLVDVNLSFDDSAGSALPDSTQCSAGTYLPSNYQGSGEPIIDPFDAPAPGGPYGTALSVFNGQIANGTWNLYVMDDTRTGSVGGINGGWSITVSTTGPSANASATDYIITAEDVLRAQAPLCSGVAGDTNTIVLAAIPDGTVTNGNVYCRVLASNGEYSSANNIGPASIGNQGVIDQGVIQAVDVFGMSGGLGVSVFNNNVKVCLLGSGRFLYLDATQSPRPVSDLPTTSEGGYTCARIWNAGTVVLVQ